MTTATLETKKLAEANPKITEALRLGLAESIVFQQKLRHYHWDVTGPRFFALHEQFETMYTAWATHVDDVAERLLALGGRTVPTLAEAIAMSGVAEDAETPDDRTMVSRLLDDLSHLRATFGAAGEAADEVGDRGTASLVDAMVESMEKTRWMLRAYLGD